MRRILFLTLVVLTTLGVTAENRLYIEDFTISPGETKQVVVNMDNDVTLTAIQWRMMLPEGLEIETRANGRPKVELVSSRIYGDGDDDHTVGTNFKNDSVRVTIYSVTSVPFLGNSGPFVTFKVTASSDFKGEHELKLEAIESSTPDIVEYIMPDHSCVVTSTVPDDPEPVVGGNRLYMEDFTIAAGETKPVTIYMDSEVVFSGLQWTLTLPEGLSVVTGATGRPRFIIETDHLTDDDDHTVGGNLSEGSYYCILYSNESMPLTAGDGALVTFNVVADDSFSGEHLITLTEIVASTAAMEEYELDDASCTVANPTVTAIDNIERRSVNVVSTRYVSPSGMVSTRPFDGVNIVVKTLDDGSQVVTREMR